MIMRFCVMSHKIKMMLLHDRLMKQHKSAWILEPVRKIISKMLTKSHNNAGNYFLQPPPYLKESKFLGPLKG